MEIETDIAIAIEAVTLDAAGTLIHVAEPVGVTYARVAAGSCGRRLDPARLDDAFRNAWRTAPPPRYRDGVEPDGTERAWWRALVADAVRSSGRDGAALVDDAPEFDRYFDRLFASYAAPEAWVVYPEVTGVLEELRSRGLKLLVVSNFDHRLAPVLEGLGLAGRFDDILNSGSCGAWKPDPAIFAAAVERAGAEPNRVLHVGDDPVADIEGATRAGLQAHRVDRPRHDLTRVLDRIGGTWKKRIADPGDPS